MSQNSRTVDAGAHPAPEPQEGRPRAASLGVVGMLRWLWAQLTSMRTALVLLFMLALGAIPGSLIPQTSAGTTKVNTFKAAHTLLDKVYQPLGMYNVYTSPWFSAIYLLLFVSLIGCIIPRIVTYAKAVRGRPPRMPARLERLPEHRELALEEADGAAALDRAEKWLKSKHFRVVRSESDAEGWQGISAERGYLREFGNLLFHVSLVFVLLGVAWNNLYSFKGTAVIVEGQGFSNVITQYDEYHAGALVDTNKLAPFTLDLKRFTATFETGEVQRGAARSFDADVVVTANGTSKATNIQVNHPLTIGGNKVHLLGHGYAVHVTVTDGQGNKAWSGPVVFMPTDGNFTSTGVIKVPDARPYRLAFQGVFLPTAPTGAMAGHSLFPDALNPELYLNAYYGKPQVETGIPENIYQLNTAGLTQFKSGNDVMRFALKPGQGYKLPNGKGSIQFDGWSRWTKIQISEAPGLPLVIGSIAFAVLGLCLSLFIRPRRLWIRTRRTDNGVVLEGAGLDRADARTGLAEHVTELVRAASGATDTTAREAAQGAAKKEKQ